jgi:NAD(P)-dependent dehydrogenase (short-subunit alcohol dehydrogenase family)
MVRASAQREPDGVEAALARYGKSHPLGRIGTGQDIANAVLFLASERASFMTGEYVCVDGGYMALGAWAGGAGASAGARE